jgi:hypothetical protein
LLEVFCIHRGKDPVSPVHFSSVLHVDAEDVVEEVEEDTWVLAIILGCFSFLCLIVGVLRVVYQNRKTKKREQFVRNVKKNWVTGKQGPVQTSQIQELSIEQARDNSIEWSIKF